MATEDANNKNTSGEELSKDKNEDVLKGKDPDGNKPAGDKTIPADAADAQKEDEVKEATPEQLEEESIDEEETESLSKDCMCIEQDGDYYCFKLKQGRWIQWSVVPYATKKMCEALCCNK